MQIVCLRAATLSNFPSYHIKLLSWASEKVISIHLWMKISQRSLVGAWCPLCHAWDIIWMLTVVSTHASIRLLHAPGGLSGDGVRGRKDCRCLFVIVCNLGCEESADNGRRTRSGVSARDRARSAIPTTNQSLQASLF